MIAIVIDVIKTVSSVLSAKTIHELVMIIPTKGSRYLTHALFCVNLAYRTNAANSTIAAPKIAPSAVNEEKNIIPAGINVSILSK